MKDILINYMEKYTQMPMDEILAIVDIIPIQSFAKGTVLLEQGDLVKTCYFVLKGCVRQYQLDRDGNEITVNFFTEEQGVTIFNQNKLDATSKYFLVCSEDCVLVVGDLSIEKDMYNEHTELESMTRMMMEEDMGAMQDKMATFIASSPEERYQLVIDERPDLLERVPQHQLASYLGIKPESLSRIKRRLDREHIKLVK